jgi:hypothetical protein
VTLTAEQRERLDKYCLAIEGEAAWTSGRTWRRRSDIRAALAEIDRLTALATDIDRGWQARLGAAEARAEGLERELAAKPVAWRWHYCGDGRAVHWRISQSPIYSRPAILGMCAIVAQPLYALARPEPEEG